MIGHYCPLAKAIQIRSQTDWCTISEMGMNIPIMFILVTGLFISFLPLSFD